MQQTTATRTIFTGSSYLKNDLNGILIPLTDGEGLDEVFPRLKYCNAIKQSEFCLRYHTDNRQTKLDQYY